MKRLLLVLSICTLLEIPALAQGPGTVVPAPTSGATVLSQLLGPSINSPNLTCTPGSLTCTYTAGYLYQGNGPVLISAGSVGLTASQSSCARPAQSSCNFIYQASGSSSLSVSTSFYTASANGNSILALATTSSAGVLTLQATYQDTWGVPGNISLTDGEYNVPLNACSFVSNVALGSAPTGTTNPGFVRATAGAVLIQAVGSANAGYIYLDCILDPPTRTSSSKGITITSVNLSYGNQGAALAAAPVPAFFYQNIGAINATAAAPTATSVGGSVTTNPTTLPTATTTANYCLNASITPATAITLSGATTPSLSSLVLDLPFQVSSTATTVQVCSITVFYTNTPQ